MKPSSHAYPAGRLLWHGLLVHDQFSRGGTVQYWGIVSQRAEFPPGIQRVFISATSGGGNLNWTPPAPAVEVKHTGEQNGVCWMSVLIQGAAHAKPMWDPIHYWQQE